MMFDSFDFNPPVPVSTVQDFLRYPTKKLEALEQGRYGRLRLRPALVAALEQRKIKLGAWIERVRERLAYNRATKVDGAVGNNDPACLWD